MYKASKIDFISLDYIDMYKLLLEGRIANFPSGFWVGRNPAEAREIAIKLLRYLIDEKLRFCDEDIRREVCKKFLTKYKLHTASKLFGRSAVRYTMAAFPERELKPWQFQQDKVPISYWAKEENRVSAAKYVLEEELKWSVNDIKENLDWKILHE
jgi:hypothetical protein